METELETVKHMYTSDAGVLELDHEQLLGLRALADGASEPGAPVSPSDLLAECLGAYLAENKKTLKAIAKAGEQDELERLHAVHGEAA